ncbi:MAG: aminopeptidase [Nitrospiraceae bacterium]|nr:aminopeptidase [Nitrospiraceae bacterium]
MNEKRLSKAEWKRLEKDLYRPKKPVWTQLSAKDRQEAFSYADSYRDFIGKAKTERESVETIADLAEEGGFVPIREAEAKDSRLLWTFRGKAAALAVIGKAPICDGIRAVASHIDSPRLDLKQNPIYEEEEMAFLKTHYYGGIKKFQWVARPLAIHGLILKGDGTTVPIELGEDPNDPVFTINDLLPHLAHKVQAKKKVSEAIPAEKLNVLIGGIPLLGPEDLKNGVMLRLLKILNKRYGLVEEDLISAELEIVPAGPSRDVGLDGAFVGGYGQDDRSCAYASLNAILGLEGPPVTALALFLDKEEIGSDGNTGAKSSFFEAIVYDIMRHCGDSIEADSLISTFMASKALSADVTAGIDPNYMEVHEEHNDALIGHGICLTKYTGSGGKYSANDAHAEYVNWVRRIWNSAGIIWQAGEMGKVDEGGGGTVAKYFAQRGIDIIDAGPPLLNMHSPFEIAHKTDLFMTSRAYRAFYLGGD